MAKVVIDETTGCWVWNGATGNHGYGVFGVDKGVRLAHRWSLEQKLGRALKTEEVARHQCDERRCVAPHHLEPGSHSDNSQDMVARGRHWMGNIHADCNHKSRRERTDCPKRRRGTGKGLRGLIPEERFMAYVDTSGGDDACWPWQGSVGPHGYGTFTAPGPDGKRRTYRATRWIMGHLEGRGLEPDEHVLHGCDFPTCTNPRHLRIGTHAENMQEKADRGRHPNSKKTHCPQGHEYTEENTYRSKRGRHCRACNKGRQQKRKDSRARTTPTENGSADSVARPTHCKRGHEWTPENTYMYPDGSRYCKACNRESKRQTDKPPVHVLTHCKRGHEYTEANTYITPSTGARKCRQCKQDRRDAQREAA